MAVQLLNGETPEASTELYGTPSQLFVPTVVTKENLKITKTREMIQLEAHYTITIDFAGLYQYVWKFDPLVQRPLFAV